MIDTFLADASLLRDVAWQSTALLLAGGIASLCWSHKPARAHRLLLLAMVAAVATPLLSQTFRQWGWGLFLQPQAAVARADTLTWTLQDVETANSHAGVRLAHFAVAVQEVEKELPPATWAVSARLESVQPNRDSELSQVQEPVEPTWPWLRNVAVWTWMILTGAIILRLFLGVVQGRRLLAGARALADSRLQDALDRAAAKLGLRHAPVLWTSNRVVSPMIWCWGRRPIVVLPALAADGSANVDWVGVLCHELAHWKRRDHLASLAGEIVVAALPLQPLAWWAKRRLRHLCERACDDWVLACGRSPVQYAESLLNLLPQRRPALAMTAVRSRRELPRRIRRILACGRSNPSLGRGWTILATLTTALMVFGISLAQYRPVLAEEPPAPPARLQTPTAKPKADAAPAKAKSPVEVTVAGKVIGVEDKPLAEARVVVIAWSVLGASSPKGSARSPQVLGQTKTDSNGRFQLKIQCPGPVDQSQWTTMAIAQGYGLGWDAQPPKADKIIRLMPEQVLSGRLIGLQGQPASGVKLFVRSVGKKPERKQEAMFKALRVEVGDGDFEDDDTGDLDSVVSTVRLAYMDYDNDGKLDLIVATQSGTIIKQAVPESPPIQFRVPPEGLPFWPAPITTDDQGRFTIRGIGRGQEVGLLVRDERFAVQALELKSPDKNKSGEVTLVLAPAHVVEGTVTEAGSGKPLPHARVRVRLPGSNYALGHLVLPGGDPDWKGRRGLGGNGVFAFTVVGDAPSGNPLPDIEAQTDEQGRFRLHLFEADSFTLRASSTAGEPYLPAIKSINWPKAATRQTVNFSLPRAVPVEGKVMEAPAGKPLAGARVDFWSKGLKLPEGVRHPTAVKTDRDGKFRALLLPGTWHLLVNGPSSDYLYHKIPADKLTDEVNRAVLFDANGKRQSDSTKDPKESFFFPDQWQVLDLKPDSKLSPVVVTLRRVTLRGRLVGPDSKPVGKARMLLRRQLPSPSPAREVSAVGLASLNYVKRAAPLDLVGILPPETSHNQPVELPGGRFEFPVNDLDATYRVLFQDVENGLGAVAELKGKQAEGEPVIVRLLPSGSAQARFMDSKGKPLANYRPLIWAMLPPIHPPSLTELGDVPANGPGSGYCEIWLGQADPKHYGAGPRTDAQGRITFPNLVPGAGYRISLFDGKARDFTVETGKTVDLGDIRVAKPDETKKLPAIKPAIAKTPK